VEIWQFIAIPTWNRGWLWWAKHCRLGVVAFLISLIVSSIPAGDQSSSWKIGESLSSYCSRWKPTLICDSRNCRYIDKLIDRWMSTIADTLLILASLADAHHYCTLLISLDGHCLHVIYSFHLTATRNTSCPDYWQVIDIGPPSRTMVWLTDTAYGSIGFCSCVLLMYSVGHSIGGWCAQFDLM